MSSASEENPSDPRPDVLVTYLEQMPSEGIAIFGEELDAAGLVMLKAPREDSMFAGLPLLFPQGIMVVIAAALVGEIAKASLKGVVTGIKRIARCYLSPSSPQLRLVATPGKLGANDLKYSMTFSLQAMLGSLAVKLVFPASPEPEEIDHAIEEFMAMLQRLNGDLTVPAFVAEATQTPPLGNVLVVTYSPQTRQLVVVDTSPKKP